MPENDVARDEPRRPLSDEGVFDGGPGTPSAPEQDTPPAKPPEPVKIKLDGKEYEVSPDLRDAIDAYRRELNERDGKRGSELEGLRRAFAELQESVRKTVGQPTEPLKGPKKPDPALMLTDPERYQEEYEAYRDALEEQRHQAETQKRQDAEKDRDAKEENRRAWDKAVAEFYKENQDLVGEEDLVDIIWRRHYVELKDLPLKEGFKRIAQLTRERITRLASKGKSAEGNLPPALESSRPKVAPPATIGNTHPQGTLSELIRRRQQAMRGEKPEK